LKQNYFILVLAHSLHGRLRRIHIPYQFLYGILLLAVFGAFSMMGLVSSYARMAWKVAGYNALLRETNSLRTRYQSLQKRETQTKEQLASLQMLASQVSVAYGFKKQVEGSADISSESRLAPSMPESLQEYNFLRDHIYAHVNRMSGFFPASEENGIQPGMWPVEGRLLSSFGQRNDPFSGEGAYHAGVDIAAPSGTPVQATASGTVTQLGGINGYGKLVIVDHGNGYETYYAHLSQINVIEGQQIRRGETIGEVGSTGRATGPHLHYEVRLNNVPVNPYRFLARTPLLQTAASRTSSFGF
jgi:murein DD-endopeptidase MepM/ murein hydrolase activator NlpD